MVSSTQQPSAAARTSTLSIRHPIATKSPVQKKSKSAMIDAAKNSIGAF